MNKEKVDALGPKIEQLEKTSSDRESNPGQLACAAIACMYACTVETKFLF